MRLLWRLRLGLQTVLVPKLCLGMRLWAKLCFAWEGCPRVGAVRRPQTPRLGNGVALPSAFPNGVWERGGKVICVRSSLFVLLLLLLLLSFAPGEQEQEQDKE